MSSHKMPFDQELADEICVRLTEGEFLADITKLNGLPSLGSVWSWSEQNPDFRTALARAFRLQAHATADRAVRVALEADDASLGRLHFSALTWHASKKLPTVYGDKVGGGPVTTIAISATDPVEAARIYKNLMEDTE